MAFDKEQIQQLNNLLIQQLEQFKHKLMQRFEVKLNDQRSAIMADTRIVLNVELHHIREHLRKLAEMESEDVTAAYEDIVKLKKRIERLERILNSKK